MEYDSKKLDSDSRKITSNNFKKISTVIYSPSSANDLQKKIGNQAFGKIIQRMGYSSFNQAVIQKMKPEDWYQKIGTLVSSEEDTDAKKEYQQIHNDLKEKNWELQPTDEEHCFTSIDGVYIDGGYEIGELEPLKISYKKIVFYNVNCPLIDLKHEYDHVLQLEKIAEFRKEEDSDTFTPYLPTEWKYYLYGDEEEPELDSMKEIKGHSSFLSDSQEEINNNIKKLINKGNEKELRLQSLSESENEVVEYHAYLRELGRMDKLGIEKSKKLEIVHKIEEHEEKAENFISNQDDSEVIKACNAITPFENLKTEYRRIIEELKIK